eukprot:scaffold1280_cov251-Amphora_coffeaeformis.AAC.2
MPSLPLTSPSLYPFPFAFARLPSSPSPAIAPTDPPTTTHSSPSPPSPPSPLAPVTPSPLLCPADLPLSATLVRPLSAAPARFPAPLSTFPADTDRHPPTPTASSPPPAPTRPIALHLSAQLHLGQPPSALKSQPNPSSHPAVIAFPLALPFSPPPTTSPSCPCYLTSHPSLPPHHFRETTIAAPPLQPYWF